MITFRTDFKLTLNRPNIWTINEDNLLICANDDKENRSICQLDLKNNKLYKLNYIPSTETYNNICSINSIY